MDQLLDEYRNAIDSNENAMKILEKLNEDLKALEMRTLEDEIKQRIKNLNIRTKILNQRIELKRQKLNSL